MPAIYRIVTLFITLLDATKAFKYSVSPYLISKRYLHFYKCKSNFITELITKMSDSMTQNEILELFPVFVLLLVVKEI